MASINKVILIGNLGRDPELRYTPAGRPVANFSIATTEKWTDKSSGEKRENTQWHNIVLWGRQAEIANQYLKKGSNCYIEGRLETRSWEDKDKIKRYTTEIIGSQLQLLSGGNGGGRGGSEPPPQPDEYFDSFPEPGGGSGGGANYASAGASAGGATDGGSAAGSVGGGVDAASGGDDDLPF